MNTAALGIDLRKFSWPSDPRDFLRQPWAENGRGFASDGFIAVMVDGMPPLGAPQVAEKMAGKIPGLLAKAAGNSLELSIKLPDDPPATCSTCLRSGFVMSRECDECDGDGDFTYGSHVYECKECSGEGSITRPSTASTISAVVCHSCAGTGVKSRFITLQHGDTKYLFQEKYLRLISCLPAAKLFVSDNPQSAARFEFEGGAGILMPCR